MQKECITMVRFSGLSILGQFRKHLSVALIFGIDLAQHSLLTIIFQFKKSFFLILYLSSYKEMCTCAIIVLMCMSSGERSRGGEVECEEDGDVQ